MENKIFIIGIIGADGTGKTTLAKMLADYYHGHYHSVHLNLLKLFFKDFDKASLNRPFFTRFSNNLRKKSKDTAIAIRGIVEQILEKNIAGTYIIESIGCLGEIKYLKKVCFKKAELVLLGIHAYPEDRLNWMNKSDAFPPVADKSGAILFTKECRAWALAKPWEPNIDGCLEKIPKTNCFYNDGMGSIDRIFIEVKELLKNVLPTPP